MPLTYINGGENAHTEKTNLRIYVHSDNILHCLVFIQGKGTLLEIFKIQVDDIILPWVADGVPMYWWVPMS